ncbi:MULTISPECIES: hypothetical protein, partial [Comamonas]|uniref:hypothetical protein n=1 Tax=Comamonas TaxID=283 RepID=UPI00237E38D2
QQARQQFFGYVVFLGVHSVYGQAGLRRLLIGRLHKILHTLHSRAARTNAQALVSGEATLLHMDACPAGPIAGVADGKERCPAQEVTE